MQDGVPDGRQIVVPVAVARTGPGIVLESPIATEAAAPEGPVTESIFAFPEGTRIRQVHAISHSQITVLPGAPLNREFRAIATFAGCVFLPSASFDRLVLGASYNGEVHSQQVSARQLLVRAVNGGDVQAGLCTSTASCHASSKATITIRLDRAARITTKTGGGAKVHAIRVLHTPS